MSSLLDDFARECVLIEKTRQPDGEGGYMTVYTEGASFKNYQAINQSMEARIAEKQGVTSIYSGMVDVDFPIEYNDLYRDKETGFIYRVTSNPDERKAPKSSGLNKLKYFTVEKTELNI